MLKGDLRIILMGSPDFGVPSFEAILREGYSVPCIVTVPDRQKGRGRKVQFSDVKKFAIEKGIPVLQPENLGDPDFIKELKEYNPDLFVIIAFRILPREVFLIPKYGSINLHASLLPKYRGAAPINHAIINGEKETGLTTFFLNENVDTGNIILQKKISIGADDTFGEVYGKMSLEGPGLVLETLEKIINGNYEAVPQDNTGWTKAPKIFREKCRIDWDRPAKEIHNFIRGLSPLPGAYTTLERKSIKILRAGLTERDSRDSAGTFFAEDKKLLVNTSDKLLEIKELKPEGRSIISSLEFIIGRRDNKESRFV
ncbi:MAG: methionyl-tRNA formyltransferase [Ignavibacteria bacterium]